MIATTGFSCFTDSEQLLNYAAREVLQPRVDSLYRDVMVCALPDLSKLGIAKGLGYRSSQELRAFVESAFGDLSGGLAIQIDLIQGAPFPALMFCCSTLEMLADLYAENKGSIDDAKVQDYNADFLNYPRNVLDVFWKLYRGGLAHTGAPNPVIQYNREIDQRYCGIENGIPKGSLFTWALSFDEPQRHFKITKDTKGVRKGHVLKNPIKIEYKLSVDIPRFAGDIIRSVNSNSGYYNRLRSEIELQKSFDASIFSSLFPGAGYRT